ncbi:MAG: hypothetical protein ACXWWN_01005 [Gemmatimonadales bacterium]
MRAPDSLPFLRSAAVPLLLALSACTTPDKVALPEFAPTSSGAESRR